jgi:5-methylcytosine-specific restriction protein A
MAERALRQCNHLGCTALTRESRCEAHKRVAGRGTSRNRPGDPFYSSAPWRRLRAVKLAEDPLCEECLELDLTTPGEHVDHILDRRDRPDLALAKSNLKTLCASHHNRKTALTMAKRRRGRRHGKTRATTETDADAGD